MAKEYVVTAASVGYRTEGNVTQYARRGERITLDADQAKRHVELGTVEEADEYEKRREAEEEARRAAAESPDTDTAGGQEDVELTSDALASMTVDQVKAYVEANPDERDRVVTLEKDGENRKGVVALADDGDDDNE